MAFRFHWPIFSQDFLDRATAQLESALNGGTKPAQIAGRIAVKELHLGTQPPDLEMLEIGELAEDKFRGMFKLTYAGDAYLVLQMSVQANPLPLTRHERAVPFRSSILAANKPLVVPMQLSISNLKLRGVAALVVDKAKGVTLTFKNDPLERVDVSSTFDNVAPIRRFLQNMIEKQLRKLFTEDLPALIHNLSLHKFSPQPPAGSQGNAQRWHQADGSYEVTFGPDGVPIVPAGSYHPTIRDSRSAASLDSGYYSEPANGFSSADQSRYQSRYPFVASLPPLGPPAPSPSPSALSSRRTKWIGNEPWETALRGTSDYGLSHESDWSEQEVTLSRSLADIWKASKLAAASRRGSTGLASSHYPLGSAYAHLGRINSEGGSLAFAAAAASGLRVALLPKEDSKRKMSVWRRELDLHYFQDDMSLFSRRSPPGSVYTGAVGLGVISRRPGSQTSLAGSGSIPAVPSPLGGLRSSTPGPMSPRLGSREYFDGGSAGSDFLPRTNGFTSPAPPEIVTFPPVLDAKSISAQEIALLLTANYTISPVVRPTPSNVAFRTHPKPPGPSIASVGPLSPNLAGFSGPSKSQRKVHRFRMPAKQVQGVGLVPTGGPRRSNGKESPSGSVVSETESVRSRESNKSTRTGYSEMSTASRQAPSVRSGRSGISLRPAGSQAELIVQ